MVHTHQGYEHLARERVRVSDDPLPRPRFESTAIYFEWLAQKETRDYDRRQRLLEVAHFYRSLVGIIPAIAMQCGTEGSRGTARARSISRSR